MASKKNLILGTGLLTLLTLSFQNCSPAKFSQMAGEEKVVTSGTEDISSEQPPQSEDPRQTESQEVKCDSSLVKAEIGYDSVPVGNSAAVTFTQRLPASINEEYVGFVGNAATTDLSIVARQVDQVSSLGARDIQINAQKIGFVGNLAARKIHLVAHEVGDPASLAGDLCVSAHRIPSIGRMAGSITVFGRIRDNERASMDSIAHVAGFLSLYDVNLQELHNLSTRAKMDNVHLQVLRNGAGELILQDSTIEEVDKFAGTIRLRGNSKIGSISQQASVRVIQE